MAWNEPGGNKPRDPWGGGDNNQGPPDLDEALRKLQERLNGLFGGGGAPGGGSGAALGLLPLVAVVLVAVTLWAGFYQINERERAVVLRLGVYDRTLTPGLHWTWPLLEDVTTVNTTQLREHTTEGLMLTEDENIVNVKLSVQYNVLDPKNFVLAVHDPENSLREATDSALRHVVGSSEMDQVLTEGREQIAADVQTRLQSYLDLYNTGVQVEKVNVEGTTPPEQVKAAFDDVIRAREDEERAKNEAQTYANGIIPEARGQAQRIIEEATAYRDQVVARAEGEAARFEKLLAEYQKAPAVTRERLYLDTMQDVMAGSSKVLVDVEGGNNMLYLPLDRMVSGGGAVQAPVSTSAGGSAASAPNVRELTDRVVEQLRADAQNAARRREGR